MRSRFFVAAVLGLMKLACMAQAAGVLTGTVTDPSGALVRGANVTLTNPGMGIMRTGQTKSDGVYIFPQLAPSTYDLEVTAQGFKSASFRSVNVQVGITSTLDVQLQIGTGSQKVEVQGGATAPINTQDASLGTPFGEKQISQLPLEGRNIVGLLSLQTGAVYLPTSDGRSGSIQGSRSDESSITLDGVSIDDPENQTSAYQGSLRVTLDSVQEFRTTTTNYGADLGRSSGAQVQLVTKSGTNIWHGSAYEYLRNTATSSNEYFNKAAGQRTPQLNKNVFGAAVGGPIAKNRLFFFANYEGLREATAQPVVQAVPSNSLRDGVIIYQCETASQCPGGSVSGISASHAVPSGFFGLSPAQLASVDPLGIGLNSAVASYLDEYPAPNDPGQDGLNFMGYRFTAPIRNSNDTGILRLDYKLDSAGSKTLFLRGNIQDDTLNNAPQFPGEPPNSKTRVLSKGMVVGFDDLFRANLINSFRWGFTRLQQDTVGIATQAQVLFNGLSPLPATTRSSGRAAPTHEFRDDLTWNRGTHTFQFGTDVRFTRIPRFSNLSSINRAESNEAALSGSGQMFMPGRATCTSPGCSQVPAVSSGFGLIWAQSSVALWGLLTRGTGNYNYDRDGNILPSGAFVKRRYATNEFEWYFQDQWRIRPTLTLTYGLRYSLFSPPWETNGNQVSPTPGLSELFKLRGDAMTQGIPSNAFPAISLNLAGPANGRPGFYPWDKYDFAPRVAVAWNPHFSSGLRGKLFGDGKTVIRGGYAIAYDRVGLALANLFDTGGTGGRTGSFGLSLSLSTPFGSLNEATAPRFTGIFDIPGSPLIPPAPPPGFPATPPQGAQTVYTAIDNGIKTPYVNLINLTVGRELPGGFSVETSYVGRLGQRLLTRRDFAMPMDLVDPDSGMDYYRAGGKLAKLAQVGDPIGLSVGTPTQQVQPIPYFENLFPGAAGHPVCDIYGVGAASTATQVIYDTFLCFRGDYGDALLFMDADPTLHSRLGRFAYFMDQFCCAFGSSTIGESNYHSFQLSIRKRPTHGLQFDVNYTLAKSLDLTSDVERGNNFPFNLFTGGVSTVLLDSWNPHKSYSFSDFDVRHQINANGIWDLPFGRDKLMGGHAQGWVNQIIGNWQLTGVYRMTSGFPFNVLACGGCFTTDDQFIHNAVLLTPTTPLPHTHTTKINGIPYAFSDPASALQSFKPGIPGDVGLRNLLRGDGYFDIDLGLGKTFDIAEGKTIQFRWETFNLTNTAKFDANGMSASIDVPTTFGKYNHTMATCDSVAGRCMQFSLRFQF